MMLVTWMRPCPGTLPLKFDGQNLKQLSIVTKSSRGGGGGGGVGPEG